MECQSIEEVIVTGRAQKFYLETETRIGSKLDIDALDLPQSVQLLTNQLILDQAARDVTDLYRSIAGVSEFSYSGVTFRGFRESDNVFYDGVRGDPFSGFSVPQLFNVERVEVLKGPTASLYGGGEPGGMINYVTRKPSFDPQTRVILTGGNFDLFGGSADIRGPINDKLAFRVGAFYEDQNSFRNNADEKNVMGAASLMFQPSQDTAVTAMVDYVDQELGGHRVRGVLVRDNGDFIVDRSYNSNEDSDFQTLEAFVGQLNVKHRFSDSLNINATFRYLDNEREQEYHEPRGWVDNNGDGVADENDGVVQREFRDQERSNEEYSLTLDIVKSFDTGSLGHQLLFGGDFFDVEADGSAGFARGTAFGVVNLNVFDLNYGETDPSSYNIVTLPSTITKTQRYGFYLQDRIEFNEKWSVMAGLRYDDFEDEDEISGFAFSDDNVSSRVGLVYKPVDEGSIYLNYSDSFQPVGLADQFDVDASGTLDPETGDQWELGWKHRWMDGQLLSTVAVYRINKQDTPQQNPEDSGIGDGEPTLINLGEVRSEGFEITLVGDISDDWTMTANYAWNDTEILEGSSFNNSVADGDEFANAPEHQIGLWTRYDIDVINSSIALGVDYVSEQFSFNGQRVKPYTVLDGSWTTDWRDFTLQLNVNNILDETYAVSGFQERTGHFPGAPREFIFQLRYEI